MSEDAASTKAASGSVARGVLHVAAGVGAALTAVGFMLWIGGGPDGIGLALLVAIAASQVAAWLGWPLIGRRLDSDWLAPLCAGFVMAVVVHIVAGLLWIPATMVSGSSPGDVGDALELALFSALYSAIFVGWITAPVAMIVAVFVNRLRRKELARDAVALQSRTAAPQGVS